jgi:hypothetical protein
LCVGTLTVKTVPLLVACGLRTFLANTSFPSVVSNVNR